MRDYCQYFFTTDDTPFGFTAIAQHYFFKTQAECDAFVAANPVSPGGGTLSATAPIWFRFDAAIALGYINAAALTNLGTPESPIFSGSKQMIYFDSPRKFGVNSFEEKRASAGPGDTSAAKGNFAGAQTLVDSFIGIMKTLIKSANSKGDKRTAGIVQDLLNKFLNGQESITAILDELRKLFII